MALVRLEILSRESYQGGRPFGATGAYERIDAIAHYAVDPEDTANAPVVDLKLAERGEDGRVHFSGDVTVLKPLEMSAGNGALFVQVPNRGNRSLARFNMSTMFPGASAEVLPGDGFLFETGWTVAWAGWQWDVPRSTERLRIGLEAPQVPLASREPDSQMQLRIQPDRRRADIALTDQHVGDIGRHEPIATIDVHDSQARLLVRERPYDTPTELPRDSWRFARDVDGKPVEDDGFMWLDGGFQSGLIYDVLYTPRDCPVAGAGLLATRDLASFLRHDADSPLDGHIQHVIGEGQSQCGRFLRTYLYYGLNNDEAGRPALDGVLAHVAGGRRGEFNHRHAQPSVQPTPSFGHLFPFADGPQVDPRSGQRAGLLDAQRARGEALKIFFTDTSAEYWRGDAGLIHTDLESGGDATLSANVRRYLFASTQHGPGAPTLNGQTPFGSVGANDLNIVDYRPLYRAALSNLLAWVAHDVEPPPSLYPSAESNTRRRRCDLVDTLAVIPGMTTPEPAVMTTMYPLDLGPGSRSGLASLPALITGDAYPDWVSAVDVDGNEIGGVRMPDIAVPVATHTGFNPRHPDTGGAGQLLEYVGSTVPLAVDAKAREANGDTRLSIAERYSDRTDYLNRVRAAARDLVADRYLLERDVDLCVDLAAERYDLCAGAER